MSRDDPRTPIQRLFNVDPLRTERGQRKAIHDMDWELDGLIREIDELSEQVRARERDDQRIEQRFEKLKAAFLRLRARTYRVEMVVEALFVHLEREGVITQQQLLDTVEEVDAADGRIDGQARKRRT